jgi:cell wall-associated NlpC family hydrolase
VHLFRAVLLAAVTATLASATTAPARDATATIPSASSLSLQKVVVDTTGMLLPNAWSVSETRAQWSPPWGQSTYEYALPARIPPAGAPVTLKVTSTAIQGSRFAPALGISGDVEIRGDASFQVAVLAESGESKSASGTFTLVPRNHAAGTIVRMKVGLLDGARITFEYKADAAAPGASARAKAAVAWARSQLGSERWFGRCQSFVQRAYGAPGGAFRTANDAAAKLGVRKRPLTDAPIGALVYFRTIPGVTAKTGHVGIYVGGGKIISALGTVRITGAAPGSVWHRAYAGWVEAPASWPGRPSS